MFPFSKVVYRPCRRQGCSRRSHVRGLMLVARQPGKKRAPAEGAQVFDSDQETQEFVVRGFDDADD